MALQQNRNIPCMWDIFDKPSPNDDSSLTIIDDLPKSKLAADNSSSYSDSNGTDSAISVGSASDEEPYFNGCTNNTNTTKKKKRCGGGGGGGGGCGGGGGGRKDVVTEPEVKYLERHLSMKKTIRKKIMRDLQKAFVEDPNEFRVDEDSPPEQLKAEINLQSLSFASAGKKKDKKNNESNFLDFLRTGSGQGECKGNGANVKCIKNSSSISNNNNNNSNKGYKDADGDSGHGSPATEESEEEDRKTSFWKRFTMKGSRSKR